MLFEDVDKREVQLMRSIKVKYFRGVVHMKKQSYFLVLSLVLVLSACSNGSSSNDSGSKSDSKDSKETVKIKNNFEASGKERDGSDAKKVSNTVEVPKILKMQ